MRTQAEHKAGVIIIKASECVMTVQEAELTETNYEIDKLHLKITKLFNTKPLTHLICRYQ